jgi:hypothetical protein
MFKKPKTVDFGVLDRVLLDTDHIKHAPGFEQWAESGKSYKAMDKFGNVYLVYAPRKIERGFTQPRREQKFTYQQAVDAATANAGAFSLKGGAWGSE